MRRICGLLVLGLAIWTVRGAAQPTPKPAPGDASFETLKKEYDDACVKHMEEVQKKAQADQAARKAELAAAQKALEAARTDAEKQAAQKLLQKASAMPATIMMSMSSGDGPGAIYAPRFLAFAAKHPKDAAVLDALYLALVTSGGPTGKTGAFSGAVKTLQADHVANPNLKQSVRLLRMLANARDEAADAFLRDVLAKNPDRTAQAKACQALARGRTNAAELGERLNTNPEFRSNAEKFLGGKEAVEKLIANVPAAKKQADELTKILRSQFNDICPDLSVGNAAPELVSQALDGKTVKLSDLKGKVVVLDIWTTWCGPCRAMIPHEREMVAKLRDKPFVLVSISADKEKDTVTKFLAKEPMPWTHWWNGSEGGILDNWNVEYFPTIYVLDAAGVIRHKDLRGEELEEAVNGLIRELELKKSNQK